MPGSDGAGPLTDGGRGRGRRRGMGRSVGAGVWPPAPIPKTILQPRQSMSKQEELRLLKQQAEAMGGRMQETQERIRQLEEEEGA